MDGIEYLASVLGGETAAAVIEELAEMIRHNHRDDDRMKAVLAAFQRGRKNNKSLCDI